MTATLDRKDWETFVTGVERYEEDLTPQAPPPSPPGLTDAEWCPTITAHYCFATVQLNRRDGSHVVGMGRNQSFRIGRDHFTIMEVLHRDGPCVVLRCAMRPEPKPVWLGGPVPADQAYIVGNGEREARL